MGDRGLPARVRRVRAVSDRARRAGRAGRAEADGRCAGARSASAASRTRSTRSASPARRCREGDRDPPRRAPGRRALDIRLLVDHREDLIAARTADQQRLRWHLHDLWPELEIPAGALDTNKWLGTVSRRLARAATERPACGSPASSCARSPRAPRRIRELEAELAALVESYAPQLLAERGCGPLTAAKLIGEIAGADRFAHRRQARTHRRAAPIPASSGNTNRHRLDRGGNRQLNCALHRLAVNKGTLGPRHRRLPRAQTSRGQVTQGSAPLPQAPPRPPRLADSSDPPQLNDQLPRPTTPPSDPTPATPSPAPPPTP